MAGMSAKRRIALTAGLSSFLGPAVAALYETGHLRIFPGAPMRELWLLVIVATFGVGIGALSIWIGSKVAGIVCFLTNAAVLALYGFIAAFFTLGGSR